MPFKKAFKRGFKCGAQLCRKLCRFGRKAAAGGDAGREFSRKERIDRKEGVVGWGSLGVLGVLGGE